MGMHALERRAARRSITIPDALAQAVWLTAGLAFGFLVPFVFADTLEIERDLYYGIYGALVIAFLAVWARATGQSIGRMVARRWPLAVGLGALFAGALAFVVVRTDDSTPRPDGLEFVGALAWRGVFYGAIDGLLLSAFPILAVFAAFAGTRLRERLPGKFAIGVAAMLASLAMTATYHFGYSDFRGEKVRKPLAGDLLWSAPTLLTLNPLGAPIAHVGLHTAAVVHSYDTDVFLPPHPPAQPGR